MRPEVEGPVRRDEELQEKLSGELKIHNAPITRVRWAGEVRTR